MARSWCEIDAAALAENIRAFRRLVGPTVRLAPTVKANAYGHGLLIAARAFLDGGADWLCVDALEEAQALREAGITAPLYVLGYVPLDALEAAAAADVRMVVYNRETVSRLRALGRPMRLHIKIETGNHRQGLRGEALRALAREIADAPHLELEGAGSHFSNIGDTTDHRYAREQLAAFEAEVSALREAGHALPLRHLSNTAATLLWPDRTFEMVRLGIGAYGMWPSKETMVTAFLAGRRDVKLRPALRWKTRLAQVKSVPVGAFVGYGCTFMTTHRSRLAVLPVGYYDGYDRALSNTAHVLVRGQRAPVRGRVCMNMTLVDVTDIPNAALEDEAVLLGAQGDEVITAEQIADWSGTINYEVVTRIAAHQPRLVAPGSGEPNRDASDRAYRAPREAP